MSSSKIDISKVPEKIKSGFKNLSDKDIKVKHLIYGLLGGLAVKKVFDFSLWTVKKIKGHIILSKGKKHKK
jgi:hypothetical protein